MPDDAIRNEVLSEVIATIEWWQAHDVQPSQVAETLGLPGKLFDRWEVLSPVLCCQYAEMLATPWRMG